MMLTTDKTIVRRRRTLTLEDLPEGALSVVGDFLHGMNVMGLDKFEFYVVELPFPVNISLHAAQMRTDYIKGLGEKKTLEFSQWMSRLNKILKRSRHPGHLQLSLKVSGEEEAAAMHSALSQTLTRDEALLVKCLHLEVWFENVQLVKVFLPIFKFCTSVRLFARNGGCSSEDLSHIFSCLSKAKHLTRLDLDYFCNNRGDPECPGLRELVELKNLQFLTLRFEMLLHLMRELIWVLSRNPAIKHLIVGQISDVESGEMLANHLSTDTNLESLTYRIPDDDLVWDYGETTTQVMNNFLRSLYTNHSLSGLSFVRDDCVDAPVRIQGTAETLITMLKKNKSLTSLHLGNIVVSEEEAKGIAKAFQVNKALKQFLFNRDDEDGMKAKSLIGLAMEQQSGPPVCPYAVLDEYRHYSQVISIPSWPYFHMEHPPLPDWYSEWEPARIERLNNIYNC